MARRILQQIHEIRNFESNNIQMFDDCWLFGDNGIFCFGYFCDIHVFILELKAISFQLPFSFFFILVLPLPLIFLRVTHSKVFLHLFISFLSNLRVRFLRDVHTRSLLFSS